jgi:hypothetical protein
MWLQLSVAQGGAVLVVVEVEPWVLPAGADAEVGREPTAAADAGVDATADGKVGRWGHDGTPSGTLEEHYRTELPQPSSSLLPYGRSSHRPR